MHALIVVAHPKRGSRTHQVAGELKKTITAAGHTAELADLAAEGFDPRFGAADIEAYREGRALPADVRAEHRRIDRADALVLVYPVYWWSFPALLKGWIDRVFCNGWAYDEKPDAGVVKLLQRLRVYQAAVAGADIRTYARHGYYGAMTTQIDHGIFDYCGAQVVRSELLVDSHGEDWSQGLEMARELGRRVTETAVEQEALAG